MRRENSNDVFYITYSKWKVWGYAVLCWIIACIPLLPIVVFSLAISTGDQDVSSNVDIFVICGPLFLLFAAMPFLFLTKLKKPIATLTRTDFSGVRNFKTRRFLWTSNTVTYSVKSNLVIANLDANQSRSSKLWAGPKAAVGISMFLVKEKHQEILDAIDRLSPYPVKQTTIWGAAK